MEEIILKKRGRPSKVDSVRNVAKSVQQHSAILSQPVIKPVTDTVAETQPAINSKPEDVTPVNAESTVNAGDTVNATIKETVCFNSDLCTFNALSDEYKSKQHIVTPYIYGYGSTVYVPKYMQIQKVNEFGIIQPTYGYVPIKVKVSEVCISNAVRYRFYNEPKLIVLESLVRTNEPDCLALCKELNERNG